MPQWNEEEMTMGRVALGYAVFMLALFLILTMAASMKVALWTFGLMHVSCALGAGVCVWWEQVMLRLPNWKENEWPRIRNSAP